MKDQYDGQFLEEADIFMLEKEERKDSEVEERHGRVKSRGCQRCVWVVIGWREIRFRVSSASAFEIYFKKSRDYHKDLLHSMWNSAQCCVTAGWERSLGAEWIHVYV